MAYLLNVVYLLLIAAASPWLAWQAWRTGKYRDGWSAKFFGRVPSRSGDAPCLWLHAVSVGEVNLLAPLIERWERLHPDWEIVISTTTQTGYQLASKRYAPRTIVYCPLDFTWAVKRAMRALRPDLLVLTELELWPNLIHAARAAGAKVAVINGRLSDKSLRGYRRISWLVRPTVASIDLIAAQNDDYARRFLLLGASEHAVRITGSIKFDGARTDPGNPDTMRLAALAGISEKDIVFLAGSTQEPEESLALDAFQQLVVKHPDRKSTRLNSSHSQISYAVFCLKKKKHQSTLNPTMNAIAITNSTPSLEPLHATVTHATNHHTLFHQFQPTPCPNAPADPLFTFS